MSRDDFSASELESETMAALGSLFGAVGGLRPGTTLHDLCVLFAIADAKDGTPAGLSKITGLRKGECAGIAARWSETGHVAIDGQGRSRVTDSGAALVLNFTRTLLRPAARRFGHAKHAALDLIHAREAHARRAGYVDGETAGFRKAAGKPDGGEDDAGPFDFKR